MKRRNHGKRTFSIETLILAVAVQALVLLLTVFVVVFVPSEKSDPEFTAGKTIYLPQRELEHRVHLAEQEQVMSRPHRIERISTAALLPDSLPKLPELQLAEFNSLSMEMNLQDASALLGQSGIMAALHSLKSEASSFSFFGIEDQAEKVVIAFDISGSVLRKAELSGVPITRLKEETRELIENFNGNTLFNLIQFSRNYDLFQDYMIPASRRNKEAASHWLDNEFRTDGRSASSWTRDNPNGIQSVIAAAFLLDPEVIFILSDGSFQRNAQGKSWQKVPWNELRKTIAQLQNNAPQDVRIHYVGFQVEDEDRSELRRLVHKYEGTYREIGQKSKVVESSVRFKVIRWNALSLARLKK